MLLCGLCGVEEMIATMCGGLDRLYQLLSVFFITTLGPFKDGVVIINFSGITPVGRDFCDALLG